MLAGAELFKVANSQSEIVEAMTKIYNSLPHDDIDFETFEPLASDFKVGIYRQLAERQAEVPQLFSDPDVLNLFKAVRTELDPFRTTDLQGYLSIAGFLGGLYYLAALAVQWFLPEIFPAFYVFLALLFFAPFGFTFFLT